MGFYGTPWQEGSGTLGECGEGYVGGVGRRSSVLEYGPMTRSPRQGPTQPCSLETTAVPSVPVLLLPMFAMVFNVKSLLGHI